jgi:hypothetical protein
VHEILDGVDVAKRNRAILAKPLPVVQRIAVVAEDRGRLSSLQARQRGVVCGQHRCWFLADLVDVCRGKKPHADK